MNHGLEVPATFLNGVKIGKPHRSGERVAWHCQGDPPPWMDTELIWDISPAEEGGSQVLFRHTGWKQEVPLPAVGDTNTTWGVIMQQLKTWVENSERGTYFD